MHAPRRRQTIKQLVFDILTGQKQLASAWNPGLEQGAIMVSLLNAPLIRISFNVCIHSDHVRLAADKNRFKVVLPDQLLESVFSGYYEVRGAGWRAARAVPRCCMPRWCLARAQGVPPPPPQKKHTLSPTPAPAARHVSPAPRRQVYMYEFSSADEVGSLNKVLYNLGTRAVLLRLLQEQPMFEVRRGLLA
jgi:hypothetical protein